MESLNTSKLSDFILLGFQFSPESKMLTFILILNTYFVIFVANTLIIAAVRMNIKLQIPMYIFLYNFSLKELAYSTTIIPKMLSGLLVEKDTISIHGCLTQFYFILFSGSVENILLAFMGYDRYLAICNPLRYSTIMTNKMCYWLVLVSWISGSLIPLMPTIFASRFSYCSLKEIDHFFCDFGPLVMLSCSDTSVAAQIFFGQAWILILSCFFVTIFSYTFIISTILKIPSLNGRQKAFSTCASHLIVVSILYSSIIFIYVRPSSAKTSYIDKTVSVLYTVLTPLLNPVIYCLRNSSMKTGIQTLIKRHWKKQ
ncbi:olfactory receptor 11L1-like [Discoglossus pictus]